MSVLVVAGGYCDTSGKEIRKELVKDQEIYSSFCLSSSWVPAWGLETVQCVSSGACKPILVDSLTLNIRVVHVSQNYI